MQALDLNVLDDLHPNAAGYRRMGARFIAQALSGETWLARPAA
ncbi:MAG TPA: hypothetical protein VE309_05155 [Caulobacteraceae bacterium]|jgi:lysophospholipase L1-like esterase|nr:hypothetical protein [Caulobacteraceae bacterium]